MCQDFNSGKAIMKYLSDEYLEYQRIFAPVLDKELRSIRPRPTESVEDFCDRALQLEMQLKDLELPLGLDRLRNVILEGLEQERPAWETTVEGLRVSMPPGTTIAVLKGQLRRLELTNPRLAADGAVTPPAAMAAVAPTREEFEALRAELRTMSVASSSKAAQNDAQRAQPRVRKCYKCGQHGHISTECTRTLMPLPDDASGASSTLWRHGDTSSAAMQAETSGRLFGEWLLDSGCTQHMSPGGGMATFRNYRRLGVGIPVRFGKRGSAAQAVGIGDVSLHGVAGEVLLTNVLHVPELVGNLFSVSAALQHGAAVHFNPPAFLGAAHNVLLLQEGRVLLQATLRGGIYWLDAAHHVCAAHAEAQAHELAWLWHRRLGHVGFDTLAGMARKGMITGCNVTPEEFMQARGSRVCEPCVTGKLQRGSHPARGPRTVGLLYRGHTDLCMFPVAAVGHGGARYLCSFADEGSGYSRVVLIPLKSHAASAIRNLVAWFETQTGLRVRRMRHDRGGEYINRQLLAFYGERGIEMEPTAPYCPESNGIAERLNGVLLAKARAMLAEARMGPELGGGMPFYTPTT